jgi:His-Xaa-Ser system radical SAM maturase HxsC
MLIKLTAPGLRPISPSSRAPFVARVTEGIQTADVTDVLRVRGTLSVLPPGFRGYLLDQQADVDGLTDAYVLAPAHQYVAHGDVVRIDPAHCTLTSIYRRASSFNTLLVKERCDNLCLMCSQPPRDVDDGWLVDVAEQAIALMSTDTAEIGITGGEPALLGERLIDLVRLLRDRLARTAVHVLSNGRRFGDLAFARALADLRHPDLMVAIPLHSDLAEEHDFVVQARGAYNDTVRGILNLKAAGVRVELRLVIHRETYTRMPKFAEFVARNLRFVDHVALMGLEPVGFARANLDALWIDALDYQQELVAAVRTLERAGMATSIYNHQLCVLDESIQHVGRKSISDWKNEYAEACDTCGKREACGGFFSSSRKRRSRGIRAAPFEGPTR